MRDEAQETVKLELTEHRWKAIILNDCSSDGTFYYAVKTTGIFCRPSCKSKPPNRENITIFLSAEAAQAAQYRPCKRCKPTDQMLPEEESAALMTNYIDNHFMEAITLRTLAEFVHGSPYHLHRTFKRIKGITPAAYIYQLRIECAKAKLVDTTMTVSEIGESVGLMNTPYFITLFKRLTGYTPAHYRLLNTKEVQR